MKGKRYKLNIDRLEVCYTAPREVIDSLEEATFWDREGYRIQEVSRDRIEATFKIEILTPGVEREWVVFAWLRIGNRFEKEEDSSRFCWIRLENNVLYAPGSDFGWLSFLYWIADDMGLEFHNITDIEIALDSNVNWFRRVRAAIRSVELTPVVLGRAYPDREEVIPRLLYIHTGDRRRYRTDTLVVKGGETSLKLYDKDKEIEDSGKEYIRESFGLFSGGLFRAEVRANNRALSDYCASSSCTQYDIYMKLLDRGYIFEIWLYYCNRLLRFKEKRNQVALLQL
jgi:hypothetical protein